MNASKETHDLSSTSAEGGEGSDQSMSDSWTVLDSSHFKDDGDLSDAESVEVLATDEPALTDDTCSEGMFFGPTSSGVPSTSSVDSSKSIFEETKVNEIDSTPEEPNVTPAEEVNDESNSNATEKPSNNTIPPRKQYFFNGAPIEIIGESFSTILLELAIYSLIIDLFILTYFGFSSVTGIFDKPGSSLVKMSPSHLQYEMDPLALQLSHVLAEWKKNPQEDHSLDRHLLKTLLLYYGGSSELSATLHSLTAKVQKHNGFIRHVGKDWQMNGHRNHLIVSGHLAHSVACILGKQDNDKSLPEDLFMTVNSTSEIVNPDFSPEPSFWLNDWHLPQYFKANDTYYRVESKPVLPPMRNLFLNLGSAKWNQYFWQLYHHDIEGKKIKEDREVFQAQGDKVTENELESEETERSPLDLLSSGDLITLEESSGNVENLHENIGEQIEVFPRFLINEDFEEIADEVEEKEQIDNWGGNYFEVLDGEEYLGANGPYQTRYVCLDDSCRPYKAVKGDEVHKAESKGKLSRLFEELALDQPKIDQVSEWSNENPSQVDDHVHVSNYDWLEDNSFRDEDHVSNYDWPEENSFRDENPVSNEWLDKNTFEESNPELYDVQPAHQKKSKIVELFEELSSDELKGENIFAGRYIESSQEFFNLFDDKVPNKAVLESKAFKDSQNEDFVNLFGDIVPNAAVVEKNTFENPKKGKLAMLFEELALEESLEQKQKDDLIAESPTKEKKSKLKRRYKLHKHDTESAKGKGKQKKKEKGKTLFENGNSMGKKKMKKRNSMKKEMKVEESELNNYSNVNDKLYVGGRKSFEGRSEDWNTRMAEGREKLRALSEKEDDQSWLFERARARRDLREETFVQ